MILNQVDEYIFHGTHLNNKKQCNKGILQDVLVRNLIKNGRYLIGDCLINNIFYLKQLTHGDLYHLLWFPQRKTRIQTTDNLCGTNNYMMHLFIFKKRKSIATWFKYTTDGYITA